MSVVLHLPKLTDDPDSRLDDPAFVAEVFAGRLRFHVKWPEVLAMAVRDGAASVRLHPWQTNAPGEDVLSYAVGGTRYGLFAPDAESCVEMLVDARQLAAAGRIARLRAWATGSAAGQVRLVAASGESEWQVVCFGRGRMAGVEFLRLPLAPAVVLAGSAEVESAAA